MEGLAPARHVLYHRQIDVADVRKKKVVLDVIYSSICLVG